MTGFRVGSSVRFGAAVAPPAFFPPAFFPPAFFPPVLFPPAFFEVACFSSSGIAVRALAGEPEETRALREWWADPPAASLPTRFGRLLPAELAGRAAREAGAS